jgi:hypothetical protein
MGGELHFQQGIHPIRLMAIPHMSRGKGLDVIPMGRLLPIAQEGQVD